MTKIYKIKCLGCGLHFALYSWFDIEWKPYCPECGKQVCFMLSKETSERQVYEFVSVSAPDEKQNES